MEKLLAFLVLICATNAFFFIDPHFKHSKPFENDFWKSIEQGVKRLEDTFKNPHGSQEGEDSDGDYSENVDVSFEEPLFPNFFSIISPKPWWKGRNVCVTKNETEISDVPENENATDLIPPFLQNFVTTSEVCSMKSWGRYECVRNIRGPGRNVKQTIRHECCADYALQGKRCEKVNIHSLMDTAKEMAPEFTRMLETAGVIDHLLKENENNYTIFLPSDKHVGELTERLQEINQLQARRRRNAKTLSNEEKASREGRAEDFDMSSVLNHVLMNHIVNGVYRTKGVMGTQMLKSMSGDPLRVAASRHRDSFISTVNCVRVKTPNKMAKGGMVHVVDGLIKPVDKSVKELLSDDKFSIFYSMLEKAELLDFLDRKEITVFAPTNDAFKNLDQQVYQGDCAGQLAMNHLVNTFYCLSTLSYSALLVSESGQEFHVTNEEGTYMVNEDAVVVSKDIVGTNGVVNVLDKVILPPGGMSVADGLSARNMSTFKSLLEEAGLLDNLSGGNITWFAPSNSAFETPEAIEHINNVRNEGKMMELLKYHSTSPEINLDDYLEGGNIMTRLEGQTIRLNNVQSTPFLNCVRVINSDTKTCGATINEINRLLIPPSSNVVEMIRARKDLSIFNKLIQVSGLEDYLTEAQNITVLAPADEAFHDLTVRVLKNLQEDKDEASAAVKRHIISRPVCCGSVINDYWPQEFKLEDSRYIMARRDFRGNVHFGSARVAKCDQIATNGILHTINKVLVPLERRPTGGFPFLEAFYKSGRNPNVEVLLAGI